MLIVSERVSATKMIGRGKRCKYLEINLEGTTGLTASEIEENFNAKCRAQQSHFLKEALILEHSGPCKPKIIITQSSNFIQESKLPTVQVLSNISSH